MTSQASASFPAPSNDLPPPSASHAGPTSATYLGVFAVLAVCTLLSFLVNMVFHGEWIYVAAGIILLVAVVKATFVAMYFMHLKFDWSRLYFLVFPVLILVVMMLLVFLPDAVVNPHRDPAGQVLRPPPLEQPQ